jgi:hypothetical protein
MEILMQGAFEFGACSDLSEILTMFLCEFATIPSFAFDEMNSA